jgi:hypothetical protein
MCRSWCDNPRMRSRTARLVVLAVILTGVVVLGIVTMASGAPAAGTCVTSDTYGTQCETLTGAGLTVTGIEAHLSWAPDVFDQHRWTFETTIYRCDPRGRTKQECAPATTAYGSLHGLRPHGTADQVCTRVGAQIGGSACTGTLNVTLPRTFPEARWVCTEYAVPVHGKWVDNGAGLAHGLRACSHVH